jgi:hypothetical protein
MTHDDEADFIKFVTSLDGRFISGEMVRLERDKSMRYGRLWVSTGEGRAKTGRLIDRYKKLAACVRRTMAISQCRDFYIAKGAKELYRQGIGMMAAPKSSVEFG